MSASYTIRLKGFSKRTKLEWHTALVHEISERQRNTSCLPAEILAVIFWKIVGSYDTHYQIKGARNDSWKEQRKAAATMRSVSQVCRLWRYTALGCKHIWGMLLDIDFNSDEWVKELVSRSNPAPLVVQSIYCPGDVHGRFLASKWTAVLDETQRFSRLHIAFNGDDYVAPIMECLGRPMPLLEYLHVENDEHPEEREHQLYHVLPDNFLSRSAPNLRSLVLSRTILSQSVDLSPFKLTHLGVDIDDNEHTPIQIPITYLLDLLAGQPLLETFKFNSRVFPSIWYPESLPSREVHLPCLAVLEIHGYSHDADDIFGNLVLQPTCDVQLHCYSMSSWTRVSGLTRGMARFFRKWDIRSEQHVLWSIEIINPGDFSISLGIRQTESDEMHSSRVSLRFEMEKSFIVPLSDHLACILECLKATSLWEHNSVLSLGLTSVHWYLAANIRDRLLSFFSSFQSVQKLFIHEKYTDPTVEHVLKQKPDSMDSIIFPNLQTLVLHMENDSEELAARSFLDYVHWRHEIGKPIPNVTMQCCRNVNWNE